MGTYRVFFLFFFFSLSPHQLIRSVRQAGRILSLRVVYVWSVHIHAGILYGLWFDFITRQTYKTTAAAVCAKWKCSPRVRMYNIILIAQLTAQKSNSCLGPKNLITSPRHSSTAVIIIKCTNFFPHCLYLRVYNFTITLPLSETLTGNVKLYPPVNNG